MKRKGKKTFRGTERQHMIEAADTLKNLRRRLKDTQKEINKGNCDGAYWDLLMASEAEGWFYANRSHARKPTTLVADRAWQMTGKVRSAFKKKCVR